MKKIILLFALLALTLSSCDKSALDTVPTSKVSGQTIFKNKESAMVALNGIYKALYLPNSSWFGTTGNTQQNYGIACHNLVADLMGEDFVQNEQGNGWFYFDYKYDIRRRWDSSSWRCYGVWNFYYKIIINANYILASIDNVDGTDVEKNYIKGQALALRAYSYFYLTLFYQDTYKGNEDKPGVPIYTAPTVIGAPRGKLSDTYTQIDTDIDQAVALLKSSEEGGATRAHKSHIDYKVACAIKAKISLVEEKWAVAADFAAKARVGYQLTKGDFLYSGFNDISMPSVMWGGEVITTEAISGGWGTLFCHLDPGTTDAAKKANGYGVRSRKCIDAWLYSQIPNEDLRKAWWYSDTFGITPTGPRSYAQKKYYYKNPTDYTGDYLYLRADEMLLIEAEAKCRAGDFGGAKALLVELGSVRGIDMTTRLASRTDVATYNSDTHAAPVTLMDEILLQRRIELWCEAGRIFDLKRLKLGFTRDYPGSNHSQKLANVVTTAGSKEFTLLIPRQEFDGNENMDINTDQNP